MSEGLRGVYGDAINLTETIEYDLRQEKNFDYQNLSPDDIVSHLAKFISDLWQIHPFEEGNTRTTALFVIKYLRILGFDVSNEPFASHSWYFRNALLRANCKNVQKGVFAKYHYIEQFFRNVLLSEKNELKNRCLHILSPESVVNDTVKVILESIRRDNRITG